MAGHSRLPMVAAFDLLCCILIVLLLTQNPKASPPHPPTFGQYAAMISWPAASNDDVDLYVRDPQGRICYFAAASAGLMNLEHDDLGAAASETSGAVRVGRNVERVVIRGAQPGEYTVNVQMYDDTDGGPVRVHVVLWELRGHDRVVAQKDVTLSSTGDERTAFRFTLGPGGEVSSTNDLQARLVGATQSSSPAPPVGQSQQSYEYGYGYGGGR